MAENIQTDRNERYRQLYNVDMTTLDPRSTLFRLVTIVDDMILSKLTPQSAAEKAAAVVLGEAMPEKPWAELSRTPFQAALYLNEPGLKKVVDFMTALANLPDAVNTSSSPKTAETMHPEVKDGILTFQPGEKIVFENGALWRDLPDWNMNVTESHQGPERFMKIHRGRDDDEEAARKWKNFSTYLALFVASPEARATPVFSGLPGLGIQTLAITLEKSQDAWNFHKALWWPAAVQWMRIAGDEIEKICKQSNKEYFAGELWKAEGGGNLCDSRRFEFWKKRLAE